MTNLTTSQIIALKKSDKKAKIYTKDLMHLIENKFSENNISLTYIPKIVDYIKNNSYITTMVPMIFDKLILSPVLKNCFEVRTHVDEHRQKVEDILFCNAYTISNNSERPKYGSVNLIDNIAGDPNCSIYGNICLKYKEHIKSRTTFTFGDTYGDIYYICTFNNLTHLLYYLDINTLKHIINIIDNKKIYLHNFLPTYIEAQIHGTVNICTDIDYISMSSTVYNQHKQSIDNFQKKFPFVQILIY
jgi:hypothetical protein